MDRTLTIAMPGERGWPLVVCEVVRPERLVNTESWEDWDPGELLVTVVLREQGAGTTLTSTLLFPSREVRDMLVQSGMTSGAAEAHDRLAECLASPA